MGKFVRRDLMSGVATVASGHGLMAGGTLKRESGGNKAISHLDFEGIDAAFPAAAAARE